LQSVEISKTEIKNKGMETKECVFTSPYYTHKGMQNIEKKHAVDKITCLK
jgi:hypothetical protein